MIDGALAYLLGDHFDYYSDLDVDYFFACFGFHGFLHVLDADYGCVLAVVAAAEDFENILNIFLQKRNHHKVHKITKILRSAEIS